MSINKKYLLVMGIVFCSLIVASPVFTIISEFTGIKLTLLSNEGVIIESKGVRIYVDPFFVPSQYDSKPADVVCVTHPHTDHYIIPVINEIQQECTINIFPETMSDAIALFDGIGIVSGEKIIISNRITITAFYMYSDEPLHPQESNWTNYLIDINGFVFFHAGDSTNITEYQQLSGLVDVAMLPLVPNFLMTNIEIVDAINTIQPRYVLLFHDTLQGYNDFYNAYGSLFEATFLNLDHYTSHRF